MSDGMKAASAGDYPGDRTSPTGAGFRRPRRPTSARDSGWLQPADLLEARVQPDARRDDDADRDRIAEHPLELRHVLEVHSPDAGEGGRDGEDRRPGGDLLRDFRFAD